MKRFFLAIVLICLSVPAFAQQPPTERRCYSQDKMFELLSEGKYKEFPIAAGVTSSGNLFEIYHNEETSTFTTVVTSPNKISCVDTYGGGFYIRTDEQRAQDAINRLPAF